MQRFPPSLPQRACALALAVMVVCTAPTSAALPDVAPPQTTIAAAATVGGSSTAIAASEDYVFIGDGQGVASFAVRGATLSGVARRAMPGLVRAMALDGDRLAVGCEKVVWLFRLVGGNTYEVGQYAAGGAVNALAFSADRLFVGAATGLEVVDMSDPRRPQQLGALRRTHGIDDLAVDGDLVYAISGSAEYTVHRISALILVSVSDPRTPQLLIERRIDQPQSLGVALVRHGAHLFVAGHSYPPASVGRWSFDIWAFDANTLERITMQRYIGNNTSDEVVYDLALYGDYLVAVGFSGLHVIDPGQPEQLPRIGLYAQHTLGSKLAVAGTQAFVSLTNGGIAPFDLSDPRAPQALPEVDLVGPIRQVALSDDALFTVSYEERPSRLILSVFDLRSPATPDRYARMNIPTVPPRHQITIGSGGMHALFDLDNKQTQLIDARTPGQIDVSEPIPGDIHALAVHAEHLYTGGFDAATMSATLIVRDLASFRRPRVIGSVAIHRSIRQLAIADGRLYAVTSVTHITTSYYLEVYSLDDPIRPEQIGEVSLDHEYNALAVVAGIAYVSYADDHLGVQIIDLRDPTEPVIGARFATDIGRAEVAFGAGRLAVGEGNCQLAPCRLQMYDLTNPLAPALLAVRRVPQIGYGAGAVSGGERGVAIAHLEYGAALYTLLSPVTWLPAVR